MQKLKATEKRLEWDSELLERYADQIDDMVSRGVALELTPEELAEYEDGFTI